jgi:hypothetical protein
MTSIHLSSLSENEKKQLLEFASTIRDTKKALFGSDHLDFVGLCRKAGRNARDTYDKHGVKYPDNGILETGDIKWYFDYPILKKTGLPTTAKLGKRRSRYTGNQQAYQQTFLAALYIQRRIHRQLGGLLRKRDGSRKCKLKKPFVDFSRISLSCTTISSDQQKT